MPKIMHKNMNFSGWSRSNVTYEYSPDIYSTEEREIGVWTDDKPLYQKTISLTFTKNTGSSSQAYAHNIDNVDYIWVYDVSNNVNVPRPSAGNSYAISVTVTSSDIYVETGVDRHTVTSLVTLRYTKTTDVAGSGSFTTSGVPAIHYDDTEKVIGTWFGETLYEKTVYCGNLTNNSTKNVEHNISNVGEIVNFSGYAYTGTNYTPLPFVSTIVTNCVLISAGSTNIEITTANNRTSWVAYVTLQYTKATS